LNVRAAKNLTAVPSRAHAGAETAVCRAAASAAGTDGSGVAGSEVGRVRGDYSSG